eukprot:NODE_25_length_41203_cov_0.917113.p21 type:complete len:108 gc:universal NODE_25_length_41203_cov_0.917113:5772-5449(-)
MQRLLLVLLKQQPHQRPLLLMWVSLKSAPVMILLLMAATVLMIPINALEMDLFNASMVNGSTRLVVWALFAVQIHYFKLLAIIHQMFNVQMETQLLKPPQLQLLRKL